MTSRLIIARHGNTFAKGDTPTRVGAKTDLPLVEEIRSRKIGSYLKKHHILPTNTYAAPLKRTMETARLALLEADLPTTIKALKDFTEIDYGPDENKTEEAVIARIGEEAIELWNKNAIVPPGWIVDTKAIIQTWQNFATKIEQQHQGENTLLVSSNGIIRFAPYITGDFEAFAAHHDIKVRTGGICIFEKTKNQTHWKCVEWNV